MKNFVYALAALSLTAGGAMAFYAQPGPSRVSTVDLVVDYLAPGPLADIEAEARIVRSGNRVCVTEVKVRAVGSPNVFAQGRGVYNLSPA